MSARATALAALLAAIAAGCSTEGDPDLPAACTGGAEAFVTALADAPGEVLVENVPISDCVEHAKDPGDLQLVGQSLLDAAVILGRRAEEGERDAALQLGYLLGAARRGADRTEVLHAELIRRLEQELGGRELHEPSLMRGRSAGRQGG